jgi:signal transduction histidine kinase
MGETVNNLLEAARLDSGRARWNWGEFCPETVARQAVEGVRALSEAAGNTLAFESRLAGAQSCGDADAVRRLVLNLLSNAIKHTSGGEVRVSLRNEADTDAKQWLSIEVADTGSGIPPHIRERLGEAFALNSGVVGQKHVGGTGLGLSICRGIVEAHGGVIDVRSIQGEGTTMTAKLRMDLAAPMPVGRIDPTSVIKREAAA